MRTLFSLWTVVVCVVFIAIAVWAYSKARKPDFDEAARIPLDDDDDPASNRSGVH